jgi:glycosyltransferase involved in cell wall biosynthesis
MALIAMAVWDTDENGRTAYTARTLKSLLDTVNFDRHRVVIVDNGSCADTKRILDLYSGYHGFTVITLPDNVGTAKAVNKGWELRKDGEHCVKMDNDVVIHAKGWADQLENAIALDATIGIIGLKRKDCWESPTYPDEFYRSTLQMLPHVAGTPWVVVEKVRHVMGTCQMFNSALLDKIGYLYQPRLYGFDDCLAATRCEVAGFYNAFLPHIEIDHIDTGETAYQGWKHKHAGEDMGAFNTIRHQYQTGQRPVYEPASW